LHPHEGFIIINLDDFKKVLDIQDSLIEWITWRVHEKQNTFVTSYFC